MKYIMKTFTKLIIAGTAIIAIIFLFLVAHPAPEFIQPANADIYSFTGIKEGQEFKNAMESLGIHARAYDFNGNTMFFGTSKIKNSRSARQTAILVQDQLVEKGVNETNYLRNEVTLKNADDIKTEDLVKIEKATSAMYKGELVPIRKDNNVYEMSALLGTGALSKFAENAKSRPSATSFAEFSKGYRYVEVRQSEGSNSAEIIAIWSGENFDSRRMTNEKGAQESPPDPEIPACMGCQRIRRVQALDKSEPYNINKWTTSATVASTADFYQLAMKSRGWKMSNKQKKVNKLAYHLPLNINLISKSLSFEKEGRTVEITMMPRKNQSGTDVMSIEKYANTQPNLNEEHIPKSPPTQLF